MKGDHYSHEQDWFHHARNARDLGFDLREDKEHKFVYGPYPRATELEVITQIDR